MGTNQGNGRPQGSHRPVLFLVYVILCAVWTVGQIMYWGVELGLLIGLGLSAVVIAPRLKWLRKPPPPAKPALPPEPTIKPDEPPGVALETRVTDRPSR
jgi:hypothetical protein